MVYLDVLRACLGQSRRPGRCIRTLGLLFAVLLGALTHGGTAMAGPVASAFELSGDKSVTEFSAILSEDVGYTARILPDPYRVIIEMEGVSFDLPPGAGRRPKGLVRAIRYGMGDEGKARIVIDTLGPVLITRSALDSRSGKKGARVRLQLTSISKDIFDAAFAIDNGKIARPPEQVAAAEQQATGTVDETADVVGSTTPAPLEEAPATPVIKPSLKPTQEKPRKQVLAKPVRADGKKVIVIDPGHGGIDPGALSPSKTLEKDVVLAFSKELKEIMDADGRYHVMLTREDDRFISLKDRVAFARKQGADLFIAVHADTLRGQTATGTTIYTLSDKASDAESEELAQRENRADALAGVDLGSQSEDVAGMLIDLAQRDSRNQASMFSKKALSTFRNVTKMTGKPIRSAGFTVLKAPDVPSILIELGFLSNPKDEERLKSQAWRKSVARALSAAIDAQFGADVADSR
ncbi:MAG: N-acetylmuramoyl-L-alanine amidase [Rhizobiales bacterium]|nr:N-acetylmuramoyl-L-alanine amidase [Hyphomicrobiales bacterium]